MATPVSGYTQFSPLGMSLLPIYSQMFPLSLSQVCKIHRKPKFSGGILVFVTGKQEVHQLIRQLNKTFPAEPIDDATISDSDTDGEGELLCLRLFLNSYARARMRPLME